jgi:hypothetical protein
VQTARKNQSLLKVSRVKNNIEQQANQLIQRFEDKLRLKEERIKKHKQSREAT